ncbi:NAD(P)H-binding protein [Flavihumibacter sp. RY-1]|uniref:NAD(P)H-binding protein n=1 Tax=Flavihumibacter fluminis TaxID=2909236 RepID=A0ABS9BDR6_9BACT|nr:NAD(P)H-binding protein [Flavihumibacter fluminis]MCF1713183.1 NAD(P)H-binding protein [Flavihumibacter fluminis]
MSRKACLLGATGLIGQHLLQLLLEDPYYSEVHLLVRRSLNQQHPKLVEHVIDFSVVAEYRPAIQGAETIFCAVGTTLKKVKGDREAYRKVDYDIPVTAATVAAESGVYGFILVSSIGADANNNNNFYLKLKGVVEEAVSRLMIPQVHIFRPSLLLGQRKENRLGEKIAQVLAPVYSLFMVGSWKKYKPINASVVALAMLESAKSGGKGIFIHEYESILNFTKDLHPE